ncbi:MAG: orotate phosphoribosyltransferase [Coriobacteriales bacterium]|jgi:orotate phosphoribosyltransferase|nr:orotate phosphoribosyltransferase [Coriobacteriales bacterium]
MNDQEITQILQDTGAIRHGHFKLTSGRHSDTYIQCARILEHPRLTTMLASEAIRRLPDDLREQIDLVASPAVGGILWGFAVAEALNTPMIFSERKEGKMVFRRSFEVPDNARVLVAEDVVTTGGSVKEVIDLVHGAGGVVTCVCSLIDRGADPDFGADFFPLLRLRTPSWPADECKLCQEGIEIDSPGSRCL